MGAIMEFCNCRKFYPARQDGGKDERKVKRRQEGVAFLLQWERTAASLYCRDAAKHVDDSHAVLVASTEPGAPRYLVGRRDDARG